MSRAVTAQNNFTAGELAPEYAARSDLRAYANGAARLRNVLVLPGGGVRRRPGLRHLDNLPGPARLIAFAFNTQQVYLLAVCAARTYVYRDGARIHDFATPWSAPELDQLAWTQNADTLIVCHPDRPPQRITRTGHTAWTCAPFAFAVKDGAMQQPYFKFAPAAVTLQAAALSGPSVAVTASAPWFGAGHVGLRLRLDGREAEILSVVSATQISARPVATFASTNASADWAEPAFSVLRGWPVSAAFHQDRLAFGGSRDLPHRLWLSAIAEFENFDLGTGLDDEALDLGLLADQVNAIRALVPGRHLQVFTSGAEWMIGGDPLTPAKVHAQRQTRIGMPVDRTVPPLVVDGATLFIGRGGHELREFAYTDVEQAYAAADLALLAPHLLDAPVDQEWDARRRVLFVVNGTGTLAALTLDRGQQVVAWSALSTVGAFRRVAAAGDETYVAVERAGAWALERFDDGIGLDAALVGTSVTPTATWTGLAHLNGQAATVVADGRRAGVVNVAGGGAALDRAAQNVCIGLPFTHEIAPLPLAVAPGAPGQARAVRAVQLTFRLLNTASLCVDTAGRPTPYLIQRLDGALLDAPPPLVSGDRTLRSLGWRRGPHRSLWRITDDAPFPFTLLAAIAETRGAE